MEEVTGQDLISRRNASPYSHEFLNDDGDEFLPRTSVVPEVFETLAKDQSSNTVVTIVVVSVSVIVAIVVLFLLAVFVDYRQQKLIEQQCIVKKRKPFRLRFPTCRQVRQPTGIVEDAEDIGRSQPPLEIINEVV